MMPPVRRLVFALTATLLAAAPAFAADENIVTGALGPMGGGTFASCVARLQQAALARGIAPATFGQVAPLLSADPSLVGLLDVQPEFQKQPWDYIGGAVTPERVSKGRALLAAHKGLFGRIEARYGVPRQVIVAIWGMETHFGANKGSKNVLRSTATLACKGRRQEFFAGEFLSALTIVQQGHIAPKAFNGSWAGAFGNTQFMPSTFLKAAVDFDGDGRRNIIGSIPDAMASTGHYLKLEGWTPGQSWGTEVTLPQRFNYLLAGEAGERSLAAWGQLGLKKAGGGALNGAAPAQLMLPAGASGPAFLVTGNFRALMRYNNSENYVLSVGLLADRMAGGGGLHGTWPKHETAMARAERVEMQQRLAMAGVYQGPQDGYLGRKTREAVRAYQARAGLLPDGFPTRRVLMALRSGG